MGEDSKGLKVEAPDRARHRANGKRIYEAQ
jgi:hypothetical protein